jgi:hypothetical protein
MKYATTLLIPILLCISARATLEPQFILPQEYLAFTNASAGQAVSPFAPLDFDYFHLEDFEDGSLNTPGVTLSETGDPSGTPMPAFSDSVDGDDGSVDGIATGTQSLFSNFVTSSFTFPFSRPALGSLPTHAGIVWTDIGRNGGGTPFAADLVDNVTFEAFGPDGGSLGLVGPFSLGDDSISQTTAEDRFIGVINLQGISAIKISMPGKDNWEVDHLQYGFSNPEPQISISMESNGTVRVDYIGVLESNVNLEDEPWNVVVPEPPIPYIFSPVGERLFFRARKPN